MYGIDFGTTYTVVSYKKDNKICYLEIDGSNLIPTQINNLKSLKRLILEQDSNITKELEESLKIFFLKIYHAIEIQLNDHDEYKNCIITVPIRFNDLARNIIKKIANYCKFHVIKLLGEPIAAAIGVLNDKKENGYYAVYDLGGGTFDITLLKIQDDVYHIVKVDGLSNFGGLDIDQYIANYHKISINEASSLKEKTFLPELDIILMQTYIMIDQLVEDYNINGIILNGGSCYLMNIEKYLSDKFSVLKGENLQLMVSKGACIYGYEFLNKQKFFIDVVPFNLGIETLGDQMHVIIPVNSPLPVIQKEIFAPVNSKVALKILQGMSKKASECSVIKYFEINTNTFFEINFILDYDGVLFIKILDDIIVVNEIFHNINPSNLEEKQG